MAICRTELTMRRDAAAETGDLAKGAQLRGIFPLTQVLNGLAALFFAISALGCGHDLAEVTGVVTVDGQPLRGGGKIHATVFFQPASGQGASAAGIIDDSGAYRLTTGSREGVAPGEYIATCTASEIIPSATAGGAPSGRRITDPKYANAKTSGLRFQLVAGSNACDLALQSSTDGPSRRRTP